MILYKYVSSYLWRNILRDKVIRFTQASFFNDPFEMQPLYESLAEDPGFKSQLTETNVQTLLENQFNEAYKELPF